VAKAAVVGRNHVFGFRWHQSRRVDVRGGHRAEQHEHLPTLGDGDVNERPHAGHAQAARDQQQVTSLGVDFERPSQWTEHLCAVAPGRMRASHSVPRPVTRKWIVTWPDCRLNVFRLNGRRSTRPRSRAS
jgi:hypothetical protein